MGVDPTERDGSGDDAKGRKGSGYFAGVDAAHRRRVWVWGGVVSTALAALLAAVLIALPTGDPTFPGRPGVSVDATRGAETTERPRSGRPTSAPDPDDDGENPRTEPAGKPASNAEDPAGSIAYRLRGYLYVAADDGSDPVKVAREDGVTSYALSPDGSVLAMAGTGGVTLLDLYGGKRHTVDHGPAHSITWSADSKRLAYGTGTEAGSRHVRHASADGAVDEKIAEGDTPRISPDGSRVAFVGGAGGERSVKVRPLSSGPTVTLTSVSGAVDVAWVGVESLVVLVPTGHDASGGLASVSVRRVGLDGRAREIASVAPGSEAATWGLLKASPDGRTLVFAEVGDDGYCRAHVVRPEGKVVQLSVRRDTYPVGVTAGGKVLFVEGNSFQGEPSSLMCANEDGTARCVLVSGASW